MDKDKILEDTKKFVKESLKGAESAHDWGHVYRVWKLSRKISENEKADMFTVELGALLHDIADSKFCNGDETVGPRKAKEFLESLNVEEETIFHVVKIIENISFRKETKDFESPELDIVQDADRIDALGAIGIARAFNVGGYLNREIYNPEIKPKLNMKKEEYKKRLGTTINHFYEKLLLLKDLMNTETGRKIAEERHNFMENYLDEFYKEWEGER